MRKKVAILMTTVFAAIAMVGCSPTGETFTALQNGDNVGTSGEVGNGVESTSSYEALFYTNSGELYSVVEGKTFTFTPNKVKEYGYSSSGSWESYYATSAVMTIQIDGSYIESCGNTIVLKKKDTVYTPVEDILHSLDMSVESKEGNENAMSGLESYWHLKHWWHDIKEKGQGGGKMVVIQSQNGDNIGVLSGSNVTWRVSEDLPKTTVLTIDGQDVLIHRANFQIIDAKLLENE